MPLTTGQVLNSRYSIVNLLGQGGFGAVYKAWDMNLSAPCAIKENLDTSPEAQRQFAREATILSNLKHPNLAHVTDYFFLLGQGQYLAMDYVEGEDLQAMLDRTGAPIPEGQALSWIDQVSDALNYMHSQNPPIIHRDIKPANIKITPGGKAVLVDFGIAKIYDPNLKTTLGARAVTPGYSPQEQYGQGTTDARSDIYSLGATLYTLLTGHQPIESIQRTLGTSLPPLRFLNPNLSPWTEPAVLRALEVLPDNRYQSAREFAAALQPPRHSPQPAKVAVPSPVRQPITQARAAQPLLARARQGIDWFRDCSAWILLIMIVVLPLCLLVGWLYSRISTMTLSPTLTDTPIPPIPSNTLVSSTETLDPNLGNSPFQISEKDGMRLLYVPAGKFSMGLDTFPDAKPKHTVYLDPFWIDQTEITNAMYALCVKDGACQTPSDITWSGSGPYNNYPVVYVSWYSAKAYCEWAGRHLPTEAQWEKAARGTDGRIYPWGNEIDCNKANYKENNCGGHTTAVGSYPDGESPYGAQDMAGNVWEWVTDWLDYNYYTSSDSSNPTGPATGQQRVLRGGSWREDAQLARATTRFGEDPDYILSNYIGFRCSR